MSEQGDELGLLRASKDPPSDARILGPCLLVLAVFSARVVLFPALWHLPVHLPILSPSPQLQPVWLAADSRHIALLAHIGCGLVCVVCIAVQMDASIRTRQIATHRAAVRLYVLAGAACLMALTHIQAESGVLSTLWPVCAVMAWVGCVGAAVFAEPSLRDADSSRRWLLYSGSLMCVHAAQRIVSHCFLIPGAMLARMVWSCWVDPLARPWDAALGSNDSVWALFSERQDAPRVLSFEGYGAVEQLVSGISGWVGLVLILGVAHFQVKTNSEGVKEWKLLEYFRVTSRRTQAARLYRSSIASARSSAHSLGILVKAGWFVGFGAFFVISAIAVLIFLTLLLVVLTAAFCLAFMGAVLVPYHVLWSSVDQGYSLLVAIMFAASTCFVALFFTFLGLPVLIFSNPVFHCLGSVLYTCTCGPAWSNLATTLRRAVFQEEIEEDDFTEEDL